MSDYSVFLPSYSVGDECYRQIPYVTRKYGRTAVVIGGKTAMSKAKPEILKALAAAMWRFWIFSGTEEIPIWKMWKC